MYRKLEDIEEMQARDPIRLLAEELIAKPSRNDIVLMHDDHPFVGQILETVLPQLAKQNCDLFSALESIS